MAWDDFFQGANSSFDSGVQIGSDIYLKKLAAKIQARNQDKQNLWELITADKKRKDDMADWQTKQEQLVQQQKDEADTQTAIKLQMDTDKQKQAVEEAASAVDFRIKRLGADGAALADYPRTAAGIKAVEAELARLEKDSEYKRKRADEIADRDYKANSAGSAEDGTMKRYRAQGESNDMAKSIIGQEEGTLPTQIKAMAGELNPISKTYEYEKEEIKRLQSQLDAIRANRPGGEVALTDSISYAQGRFATPEQLNQLVSPEKEMSMLERIAAANAKLDAYINGGKK